MEISEAGCTFTVFGSPMTLASFGLKDSGSVCAVIADGKEITFTASEGRICFDCMTIKHKLELRM